MSDITIGVDGDFRPLIRSYQSAIAEINRGLARVEQEAARRLTAGEAPAAVGQYLGTASGEVRAGVIARLDPSKEGLRAQVEDRLDSLQRERLGRFERANRVEIGREQVAQRAATEQRVAGDRITAEQRKQAAQAKRAADAEAKKAAAAERQAAAAAQRAADATQRQEQRAAEKAQSAAARKAAADEKAAAAAEKKAAAEAQAAEATEAEAEAAQRAAARRESQHRQNIAGLPDDERRFLQTPAEWRSEYVQGRIAQIAGGASPQDQDEFQRFLEQQALLRRRERDNVFDRAGRQAGLDREFGLRFGIAEEEEFRRRDQYLNQRFTGFGSPEAASGILRQMGIDPESDLGLRTIKDSLRRARESYEEIADLNVRIANEGEREQRAQEAALRQLRDALQARANREAANAQTGPDGRRLVDLQTDERALTEQERARQQAADVAARARLGVVGDQATAAAAQRAETQAIRLATTKRLSANQEYIKNQAETIAAERRLQAAINQEAQQYLRNDPGEGGGGSRFQRIQAEIASRRGGPAQLATNYQTFGQFFQSRFLTTAGFAASGAILYGIQAQMREMIREASELQTQFRIIQGVLNSTGQTGEEAFRTVRQSILDVSAETATAADRVASIQRQLAGAFADENLVPDFDRAALESRAALQLSRVAGIPDQEITDSLTAVAVAFDQSAPSFAQIGDVIVGLEDRFGVLSTEIVRFVADIAPLGAELGFTLEELATVGAAMQQASGQAGGALAEQLRRVLPSLQSQAAEVVALFEGTGDEASAALAEAFGGNDISQVLRILLENYEDLDDAQKNQLATLAGGRREAGAFFALLNRGQQVLTSLDGPTDQYAGSLENRFDEVSQSVEFAFDKMERAIEKLGIALFDSGVSDGLIAIAEAGGTVASVFVQLLELFGKLDSMTNGYASELLGLVLAMNALAKASQFGASLVATVRSAGTQRAATTAATAPVQGGAQALAAVLAAPALVGLPTQAPTAQAMGTTPALLASQERAIATQERLMTRRERLFRRAQAISTSRGTAGAGLLFGGQIAGSLVGGDTGSAISSILGGAGLGASIGGWWGAAGGAALGGISYLMGRDQANPEQDSRRDLLRQYGAALSSIDGENRRIAEDLIEIRNTGAEITDEAYADLQRLIDEELAAGNERFASEAQSPGQQARARAEEQAQRRRLTFDEALSDYEAGRGSQTEVLTALASEITAVQGLIEGALDSNVDPTEYERQLLELEAQRADIIAAGINERFDRVARLAQLFGGEGASQASTLGNARARLAALQAGGADQSDLEEAAFAVLEIQREMLDREISQAETVAEQIAIANRGIAADAEAVAVIAQSLAGPALEQLNAILDQIPRLTQSGGAGIYAAAQNPPSGSLPPRLTQENVNEIIAAVIATGNAETQAVEMVREWIQSEIDRLVQLFTFVAGARRNMTQEQAAQVRGLREALEGLQDWASSLEAIAPSETIQGDVESISQQQSGSADDLARRIADANIALARANANGDPVRLAQLAMEAAQVQIRFAKDRAEEIQGLAAYREAQNQLADAYADIAAANLELRKAQTNDPVRQAALDLQLAQQAVNEAKGAAARARALAQQVAAQNAYRDAIRDVMDSRTELAIAIAQAAGDDVEVARQSLALAQQQLARAQADKAGEAAINRARQQVVEQQAALRDAQLSSRRADIEFALDIGRATVGQAIAQLQALLQIPNLTEQQTRDILLRIKQLRDQLGQDLAFNLPSEILPTIYEARRLIGSTQAGLNYQSPQVQNNDYRTITIELNSTDPASTEAAVGVIVAAINAPPRTGSYTGLVGSSN